MADYTESINEHYGPTDISDRILDRLREARKELDALTRDDLTPFDEFHGGGRESTRALARLAKLSEGTAVLDVGSGIGGPARTLAAEFGCWVTGIDLTEEFCRAAIMLTERLDMSEKATFRPANAVEMPFEDASFDVVWSQNTLMNIQDKARLFSHIHRVLRPGGLFAFETLLAGTESEIHFPVFWAAAPDLNFLVTPEEIQGLLSAAGLSEVTWEGNTPQVIETARKRLAASERDGPPGLGLGVIVPSDVMTKMRNSLRNNEEGRTVAVQAVFARPAA